MDVLMLTVIAGLAASAFGLIALCGML